jgi:perosamine synthetase
MPSAEADSGEDAIVALLRLTADDADRDWVAELEAAMAARLGRRHVVATASGTAALYAAVEALGVSAGDVVVAPSYTFVSTIGAILARGAFPLFVDIDPRFGTMSRHAVERLVDAAASGLWQRLLPPVLRADAHRLKGVVPVHLYGQVVPTQWFEPLRTDPEFVVLEDAAEALGAELAEGPAGSFGDAATFAFSSGKQVFAWQGGAVATNDEALARTCRELRNYGRDETGKVVRLGHNYALNPIAAALAVRRLACLDGILAHRDEISGSYFRELSELDLLQPFEVAPTTRRHAWFSFPLKLVDARLRPGLLAHLDARSIRYKLYFAGLHRQPFISHLGYHEGSLPHTEDVARRVVAFPITDRTTLGDVAAVGDAMRDWARRAPLFPSQ